MSQKPTYYIDSSNNGELIMQDNTLRNNINPDYYFEIPNMRKNDQNTQLKYENDFLTNKRSLSTSPEMLSDYRKPQNVKQIYYRNLPYPSNYNEYDNFDNCYYSPVDKEKYTNSLRSQSAVLNRNVKNNFSLTPNDINTLSNYQEKMKNVFNYSSGNYQNLDENEMNPNLKKLNYSFLNNNTPKYMEPYREEDINLKNIYKENPKNYDKFNDRYILNPQMNQEYFNKSTKNNDDNSTDNNLYNFHPIYFNSYTDDSKTINNNYYNSQTISYNNSNIYNPKKLYNTANINKLNYSYNNKRYNSEKHNNKQDQHKNKLLSGISSRNKLFPKKSSDLFKNNNNNIKSYIDIGLKMLNRNNKNSISNYSDKFDTINFIRKYINNANCSRNGDNDRYNLLFDKCERKIKKLVGKFLNERNKRSMFRGMYSDLNLSKSQKTFNRNSFKTLDMIRLMNI